MRIAVLMMVISVILSAPLSAHASDPQPARPLAPDQHFDVNAYSDGAGWIVGDTNGNGRIDYALKLNERFLKEMEAVDTNHDGRMDNFYFYRNEVLVREEIDSNHDGRIDLWVFLTGGIYIERYERDTNHDGVIDRVRRYD